MNKYFFFIVIIIFCGNYNLFGQYEISKYVFGSGGTTCTNTEYKLLNTLGQPILGNTQDTQNNCLSGFWNSVMTTVGVDDLENQLPKKFELFQNYPNPFNPSTTIEFTIPQDEYVTLKIYNLVGEEVAVLYNQELKTGIYKQRWNANGFSSGIYFYRLTAGKYIDTKKIILLK